jgi:carbamoyltransferase
LAAFHIKLGGDRPNTGEKDAMRGSLLGPEFRDEEVEEELKRCGAVFERLSEDEIIGRTAHSLAEGKAVGWMRGRMEFGPRALGNRSILADPRNAEMQKHLNLKVKFRESFRPFAPSILSEDVADWFEWESDSPYMLFVAEVLESRRKAIPEEEHSLFGIEKLSVQRSDIAAVTHVDFSARIQTVHEGTNPRFYNLLRRFKEITGCPVLINTSFNVRGEPIVCSPEDAFNCFMGTDLDVLVIENFILYKSSQPPALITNYKNRYRPD